MKQIKEMKVLLDSSLNSLKRKQETLNKIYLLLHSVELDDNTISSELFKTTSTKKIQEIPSTYSRKPKDFSNKLRFAINQVGRACVINDIRNVIEENERSFSEVKWKLFLRALKNITEVNSGDTVSFMYKGYEKTFYAIDTWLNEDKNGLKEDRLPSIANLNGIEAEAITNENIVWLKNR